MLDSFPQKIQASARVMDSPATGASRKRKLRAALFLLSLTLLASCTLILGFLGVCGLISTLVMSISQ